MRLAETYRGARRNKCLRELKTVWGSHWYYEDHARAARRSAKIKHDKAQAALTASQSKRPTIAPNAAPQPALRLRRGARGQ